MNKVMQAKLALKYGVRRMRELERGDWPDVGNDTGDGYIDEAKLAAMFGAPRPTGNQSTWDATDRGMVFAVPYGLGGVWRDRSSSTWYFGADSHSGCSALAAALHEAGCLRVQP